ncbi:MAG: hypothetical protein IJU95_09740, partial [Treponema sp.]|nr:hypothetical protein [Treponema sp.]
MKNTKKSLFASFILAVYIITLILFGISVGLDISKGTVAAVNRFRRLTSETKDNLQNYPPRSEEFYNAFLQSLGNVSDIAGVLIKDQEGSVISYPGYRGEENTSFSGSLIAPYQKSTKLNDKNGQEITLTAAIYKLRPLDLYKKLRLSFLVVLATTLLCLLYMIYIGLYGKTQDEEIEETDEVEEDN